MNLLAILCAAAFTVLPAQLASAEDYPSKPIRAVLPMAPGGPADAAMRVVAQKLTERWGQQVIVDNRAGANGNIGTEIAARAASDGYTLLLGVTGPMAINPALFAKVSFDPVKDFAPVVMVKRQNYFLVAHPSVPANSIHELVQLAKGGSYKLTQASSGIGSPAHLSGAMLKTMTNIDFVHVPYRGGGPALSAVIAGEASFMFIDVGVVTPHLRAGRVKLLAVVGPKRIAELPNTPTLSEAGFPDLEPGGWSAIFIPAGTPISIIEKLNTVVRSILRLPDVQKALRSDGSEFGANTPEYVGAFLRSEIAKWKKAIKASGARAE